MILTQKEPFLSILQLKTSELPKFTIVTGVNGAGKTHLLRAIDQGKITTDVAQNLEIDVNYFDWAKLVPNEASEIDIKNIYQQRDEICKSVDEQKHSQYNSYKNTLYNFGIQPPPYMDIWELTDWSEVDLRNLIQDTSNSESAHKRIHDFARKITEEVRKKFHNNKNISPRLEEIIRERGHIATVGERTFRDRPFGWGEQDVFQQSFSRMFLAYFELWKLNKLRKTIQLEGGDPDLPPLEEAEFIKRYGAPPWEFVNATLARAELDFQIDYPTELDTTRYRPKLTKKDTGALINFSELSSGEKVLMSFAFCLYYSLDKRQVVRRPKLLLFDEIDAPLHPSMSRIIVDVIVNDLVNKNDVHVIFATHSPSTVAVSPDDSIYLLEPVSNKLSRESKRRAIATLTKEIPTLSISFDGRRQVFVESQKDAERYQLLYQKMAPHIKSERSLVFIGVGGKGHSASGCDQVKRVVEELAEAGNISVFGLVDWDTQNKCSKRVLVLAEGQRYSIENCLLDPRIVVASAIREKQRYGEEWGLSSAIPYVSLSELGQDRFQNLVDAIQSLILEKKDLTAEEKIVVSYMDGIKLQICRAYAEMSGHELAEKVLDVVPELRAYAHNGHNLMMHVIQKIAYDYEGFVPNEIIGAFEKLCEWELLE